MDGQGRPNAKKVAVKLAAQKEQKDRGSKKFSPSLYVAPAGSCHPEEARRNFLRHGKKRGN